MEGAGYRFRQPLLVQSHIRCVQLCLRASEAKPSCCWKHEEPSSAGWGPPPIPQAFRTAPVTDPEDRHFFIFIFAFFSP